MGRARLAAGMCRCRRHPGDSVCNRTLTGRKRLLERVAQNSRNKSCVQAAPGAVCFVPRRGKARTERKGKSDNRTSSVWPVLPGKILIVQCQKSQSPPKKKKVRNLGELGERSRITTLIKSKPETPAAPGKSIGYLRAKGGTLMCKRGARLSGRKNHTMKPICSLL